MKNRVIATLLSAGMVLGLAACGTASAKTNDGASDTIVTNETTVSESAATTGDAADSADLGKEDENVSKVLKGSQKAVVVGQDWGPAVTKTILKLDSKVKADSVSAEDFTVVETKESFNWMALAEGSTEDPSKHIEMEAERKVVDAYTCDENGEKSADSEFVAVELEYNPDLGSPFCYDLFKGNNTICNPYKLTVALADGATLSDESGSEVVSVEIDDTLNFDEAVYPQLAKTDITGVFKGEKFELNYASFVPEDDGAKHP